MPIPSVLIRISTGDIIKHADLPTLDPLSPIPGLDTDLKWLIKFQPFNQPDYDIRLFILKKIEEVTVIPHPDYPLYSQYLITFDTIKRPADDIKAQVDNAERAALGRIFPPERQLKTLSLGLAVLFRETANLALTPEEEAIKTQVIEMSDKLWQNHETAKLKKTEVDEGGEPNLDADWQVAAP